MTKISYKKLINCDKQLKNFTGNLVKSASAKQI